jgi:hypothetical protein
MPSVVSHAIAAVAVGAMAEVQDGPFADTKEQLGGYYVIEVPGLDQALDWAARCPSVSSGSVEVRPNLSM